MSSPAAPLQQQSRLRSRSPTAPRRSQRDVGQEATRACRLSPTATYVHPYLRSAGGLFAYNPNVLARTGAWLDRAAFKPASLPDDLVTGVALLPTVVAGLIIFRLPAAEMFGIAAVAGTVGLIIAHWLWRHRFPHPCASPLIAAV